MSDTNDNVNELMNIFSKKLKTRRIILMSKYSDISESPMSVQDEIYTIQTLLNILEVSESDYLTEKTKSSNGIEINKTLIEEYENNIKKFNVFKEMNSIDASEQDESEYINFEKSNINKLPIYQYKKRKEAIENKYDNVYKTAPQSIIDEYRNIEIIIKLYNESKDIDEELETADDNIKIAKKNLQMYNSILKINKTLEIINNKYLEETIEKDEEQEEYDISEQEDLEKYNKEELKQKIKENELKIEEITKSSKIISKIDETINKNTEIKNILNKEDKDVIIVAESVKPENKEQENIKQTNTEKVIMAVQTLIKGQEKTLISPEYINDSEKTDIFKKTEKEDKVLANPIKTITKKDLEMIYGKRKNEPGFYETIGIINESLETKNKTKEG